MVKSVKITMAALLGAVALACGSLAPPAEARVFVGFGFGAPFYAPPPIYYGPPAVVYAPPPVVYAPPPIAYAPPPVQSYTSQPQQSWYYCDDPQGYYPTIQTCNQGWRQVPATPPAAR